MNLASSLEGTFGLTFDVDDLMALEHVREICRVVRTKLGKLESTTSPVSAISRLAWLRGWEEILT